MRHQTLPEKGKERIITLKTSTKLSIHEEDADPIDKMKNIRDKMTSSRRRKDLQEIQDAVVVRKRKTLPKTWRGEKLIYASGSDR